MSNEHYFTVNLIEIYNLLEREKLVAVYDVDDFAHIPFNFFC